MDAFTLWGSVGAYLARLARGFGVSPGPRSRAARCRATAAGSVVTLFLFVDHQAPATNSGLPVTKGPETSPPAPHFHWASPWEVAWDCVHWVLTLLWKGVPFPSLPGVSRLAMGELLVLGAHFTVLCLKSCPTSWAQFTK